MVRVEFFAESNLFSDLSHIVFRYFPVGSPKVLSYLQASAESCQVHRLLKEIRL